MGCYQDLDESKAAEYIEKTILIGVTDLDRNGKITGRHQWSGRIKTFSNTEGIRVALDDSDEYCCLPPSAGAIQRARPGVYRLKSTGKVIENPDFVTTWTRQEGADNTDTHD